MAVTVLLVDVLLIGLLIGLGEANTSSLTEATETETETPAPTSTIAEVATSTPPIPATETEGPSSSDEPAPTEAAPAPALRILAAWQLPDMQPGTPGIQYGTANDPGQHDDDMNTAGIQISPTLDDQPEPRRIEYWIVAEVADGAASVMVYAPDGRLYTELSAEHTSCSVLGDPTSVGSALNAAVHTAQISMAESNEIAGCPTEAMVIYRALGTLSMADPIGMYRVESSVSDSSGASATVVTSFESLAIASIETPTPEPTETATAEPTEPMTATPVPTPVGTATATPSPTSTFITSNPPSPTPQSTATEETPVPPSPTGEPVSTATSETEPEATVDEEIETATITSAPPPTATMASIPTETVPLPSSPTATVTVSDSESSGSEPMVAPDTEIVESTDSATETTTEIATPVEPPAASLRILAAWQLPDMQPGTPGIQYGTADDPGQHDNDMLAAGIQISPTLDDLPGPRLIEFWIVAQAPDGAEGVSSAHVTVYAPDGWRHELLPAQIRSCAELGYRSTSVTALEAAVRTSQLSAADAEQLARCGAGTVVLSVVGILSVTDIVGTYRVVSVVAGHAGATDVVVTWFENLPISGVEINVDRIDFGDVDLGVWNEAIPGVGDDLSSASAYTVRNTGNISAYLTLWFSPMVGSVDSTQSINEFGAAFGSEELVSIAADTSVCFSQKIEPNETRSLRLLVHPEALPADQYKGKLQLSLTQSC